MDTTLLPAALKGDKQSLPPAALQEVMALNGPRPEAFTVELVWAWVVIVGAVAWAVHVDRWWATLIAILVVATRQNVLGLLTHDQAHLLGYRQRFGDLLVNLFASYPLLVLTVEGYAQVHLAHHRDYFTPNDPDFIRKSGPEWSTPKRPGELLAIFLQDIVGINTVRLVRGKKLAIENAAFARRHRIPRWVRPAYYVALAGLLTFTGGWTVFLLYWVLPLVTVFQLIVRWGALCEHKYNLAGASVADSTPLILLSWWERLLLPNLNFAMHPYHHYFPGIGFSRLPEVHRIFEREGLIDERHVFRGYFSYLRFILRPAAPGSMASSR